MPIREGVSTVTIDCLSDSNAASTAAASASADSGETPFNTGIDDARAFRPMCGGMARAYYDGYAFACAVDGLA
jgi:hypothetical protein